MYKHCRDQKWGNEETLSHGEFNERVIDHVRHEEPIFYESRTLYYCVQCSVIAEMAGKHQERMYLHLEYFGRYHCHIYKKVMGSSSVKGMVISK